MITIEQIDSVFSTATAYFRESLLIVNQVSLILWIQHHLTC